MGAEAETKAWSVVLLQVVSYMYGAVCCGTGGQYIH